MTETKIVRGTIKYKKPVEKKNKLFTINIQLKNISYQKEDGSWLNLQLEEYYNAAAFDENDFEYFNNFNVGDYVELKLHSKEYKGKTYWNIFSINHIEEPNLKTMNVSQSISTGNQQTNSENIAGNILGDSDADKRDKAKRIMKECKEDCEEIFGKEEIYKEGMSQHINSMFIFRTDNRKY